ncbi:hypothetical protein RX914_11065 [Pseudomonas syringae pv. actinidiae]|nr:hypothetical protein [Pseudomonas syringae pv. actinidiae]MDU8258037.1 hypothetical protein [Pseudomonas syringae pv. actinidiae]MDU8261164.1 hypothetical protein [Pseudomonas syringae pv. actinidiae]MDU8295509.1 hypothetical protein [Pseudomonas syringae pv. actinidiae]MDU8311479.1 hypothetical protein [Pseudomonas syringae pv. actinidiae]
MNKNTKTASLSISHKKISKLKTIESISDYFKECSVKVIPTGFGVLVVANEINGELIKAIKNVCKLESDLLEKNRTQYISTKIFYSENIERIEVVERVKIFKSAELSVFNEKIEEVGTTIEFTKNSEYTVSIKNAESVKAVRLNVGELTLLIATNFTDDKLITSKSDNVACLIEKKYGIVQKIAAQKFTIFVPKKTAN